jgi:hypothetical protein
MAGEGTEGTMDQADGAMPVAPDQQIVPENPTEQVHRIVQSDFGKAMKLSAEAVRVIWDTICKGATGPELWMFLSYCKMKGLNPLIPGQVHFAAWTDNSGNRNRMIMAGIHGLRFMVARDMGDRYRQGKQTITRDAEGNFETATVSVWRRVGADWFEYEETRHWYDYEYLWNSKHHPAWKNWAADKFLEATEARLLRRVFPEPLGSIYTPDEVVIDAQITPSGQIKPDKPAKALDTARQLYADAVAFFKAAKNADPKIATAKLLQAAVKKDSISEWDQNDVVEGRKALEALRKPTATPPTAKRAEEPPPAAELGEPTEAPPSTVANFEDDADPAAGGQADLPIAPPEPAVKMASGAEVAAVVKAMRAWCADLGVKSPPVQDASVLEYFKGHGIEDLKKVPAALIAKIKAAGDTESVFKATARAVVAAR